MTKHIWLFLSGCFFLALSCTKETDIPRPIETAPCQQLSFNVGMNADAPCSPVAVDSVSTKGYARAFLMRSTGESITLQPTKGAPVEDLTTYASFSLFGYIYDAWSSAYCPNYMFGEKVQYSSGVWKTDNLFSSSLGSRKMRFYGIAPHEADGVSVSSSVSGPLNFTYTVPSSASDQKDLLVGASPEYSDKLSDMSIAFSHCLSAVTFKTGTETVDGTIRSVKIKGVYSTGKYTCGSGWSNLTSATDFTFSGSVPVTEGNSKDITYGSSTMMLIPQTLPAGAMVEVVIESGGKTHTLTASISGDKWLEGKRCIYSLSFDSIAGMKISLSVSSLALEWGDYKDITVTGDPEDQNWTKAVTGTGLTAQKINNTTLRVTNNNISGEDSNGQLTVTTEDEKRFAQVSVQAKSLRESITLSPAGKTIEYGATQNITASGTYPNGYTLNSLSGASISKDGNIISIRNVMTSYTAKDVTLTATTNLMGKTASSSIHLAAKPENIRLDKSSLTVGSSGMGTISVSGDYDSFTAALSSTSFASLSKSGNTLTITNKNTSYQTKSVTLTCTTDGDTKAQATATITLSPVEDYIIEYDISAISLSTTSVGAGGGTLTVNGGTVTQKWASGKSIANYADATISVERTTLNSSYPASVNGKTISVSSLGANIVSQGTYIVTASFSQGGIGASSKTVQFTQGENKLENGNYNPSGYAAHASMGSGITAAGGSATVTYRAFHSAYNLYSSGSTDGTVHTVYDVATVSISVNGNSAFSLSGSTSGSSSSNTCTVSHTNMGKNTRTDNVTVRVTNASSTSTCQEASKSVTNSRYTGTKYTKSHTKTGSITYGSKSYGSTTYGTKSYGSEYIKSTDYGTKIQDADTYGNWSTYSTETEKYSYSVSFAVTSWSPEADATNIANAVTASHYEREKYSQRRSITHNYHQSYTQHYYRDYTRSVSRPYTRTASQNCNYIEYRTDTFDSGAEEYVEESKSHTETWADSAAETLPDDTGSEWTRDDGGITYTTEDGGYGYQTTYGSSAKVTDHVIPSSDQSFLTWSSGRMYVAQNTATSSRNATLTATNEGASATCAVTQAKAEYNIDIH